MSFHENDYLSWYMPRIHSGDDAVNLHSSGVDSLTLDDVQIPPYDPWTVVPAFEERLAAWLGIAPDELVFTPGATGGTLLALLALTEPGDRILVEHPIYEPMLRQAVRLGEVKRFSRDPGRDWELPLEKILELIDSGTRMVMITEPSNPSGTCASRQDILRIADAAASQDALLLVNEVYRGYTDRPSLHGERENIVIVSSFSKLLGAYWMRLGWLSGPGPVIRKLELAHMNFSMSTKPAAAFGLGLMERADELRQKAIETSSQGRDLVDAWVRATPGVSWTLPQGPGFGCIRLPGHVTDDVRFVENAHRDHGVLVVPGTHFEVPGTIRLSWLQAGGRLEEGLGLLGRALAV